MLNSSQTFRKYFCPPPLFTELENCAAYVVYRAGGILAEGYCVYMEIFRNTTAWPPKIFRPSDVSAMVGLGLVPFFCVCLRGLPLWY